jgi:CubicO group peptidase (beta-lactamase class C family)
MQTHGLRDAHSLLQKAIEKEIFSAAAAEVGSTGGVLVRQSIGHLSFADGAPAADDGTVFDLASLTKPLATTSIVLKLIAGGSLALDDAVSSLFNEWRGGARDGATVRTLLDHSSGLPARLVDQPPSSRREFEHEICTIPLEYEPRTRSIYSDLGFILLGFLASDRAGRPLDLLFADVMAALPVPRTLSFQIDVEKRANVAATLPLPEDRRRGRMLVGEVHDNYAAALGGVAGHAGLFGDVESVGAFAQVMLKAARGVDAFPEPFSPGTIASTVARSSVPGSSRALGWDTMLPTSSCGTKMSASAFGHVGFTGTSLWIDPIRDRYYVLLTNRAAGIGMSDDLTSIRRRFHDLFASV